MIQTEGIFVGGSAISAPIIGEDFNWTGGDGTSSATTGGKGQGTTTREFGEADGTLYASGGGSNLTATVSNSGNGGRNGITSIAPADGIVVIRQHKEVAA